MVWNSKNMGSTIIYDKALEWCKEYYDLRLGMVLIMADAIKVNMHKEYEAMIKNHARKLEQDFIEKINKKILENENCGASDKLN